MTVLIPRRRTAARTQSGLTLVELMVALIIGLVVAAAAVAALHRGAAASGRSTRRRSCARTPASPPT